VSPVKERKLRARWVTPPSHGIGTPFPELAFKKGTL
jgi:hypothetical protein